MEKVGGQQRAEAAPGLRDSSSACAGCGADLELGRCLSCGVAKEAGGFRVLRLLNESDHARVYLAEDAAGHKVALKELIFARAPDAQTIDAFEREAALLRQISHPAIPRFVASFREGQGVGTRLYLAQQFVEGESLASRLEAHRFDEREARHIAREVLGVLAFLHGLSPPLVHRDVKPANLLVRPDGSIALVDFGCAREVAPRGTHRATVTGTFGYMPPEALGGTLDRSADLYGLGATLIHLLSRRAPEDLLWDRPPSALREALNVSPAFVAFIEKLTARDRSSRFASASGALAEFPEVDAPVPRPTPRASPRLERAPVEREPIARQVEREPIAKQVQPPSPPANRSRAWQFDFGSATPEERELFFSPPGRRWRRRLLTVGMILAIVWGGRALKSASTASRPPVQRISPPRIQPQPPAQRPPAETPATRYGSLTVAMPTKAYVWLDQVLVGTGSANLTLTAQAGSVKVGSSREAIEFLYSVQPQGLVVTASNPGGTLVVDGHDQGTLVSVVVPPSGVEIRQKTTKGQLRLPVTLSYRFVSSN